MTTLKNITRSVRGKARPVGRLRPDTSLIGYFWVFLPGKRFGSGQRQTRVGSVRVCRLQKILQQTCADYTAPTMLSLLDTYAMTPLSVSTLHSPSAKPAPVLVGGVDAFSAVQWDPLVMPLHGLGHEPLELSTLPAYDMLATSPSWTGRASPSVSVAQAIMPWEQKALALHPVPVFSLDAPASPLPWNQDQAALHPLPVFSAASSSSLPPLPDSGAVVSYGFIPLQHAESETQERELEERTTPTKRARLGDLSGIATTTSMELSYATERGRRPYTSANEEMDELMGSMTQRQLILTRNMHGMQECLAVTTQAVQRTEQKVDQLYSEVGSLKTGLQQLLHQQPASASSSRTAPEPLLPGGGGVLAYMVQSFMAFWDTQDPGRMLFGFRQLEETQPLSVDNVVVWISANAVTSVWANKQIFANVKHIAQMTAQIQKQLGQLHAPYVGGPVQATTVAEVCFLTNQMPRTTVASNAYTLSLAHFLSLLQQSKSMALLTRECRDGEAPTQNNCKGPVYHSKTCDAAALTALKAPLDALLVDVAPAAKRRKRRELLYRLQRRGLPLSAESLNVPVFRWAVQQCQRALGVPETDGSQHTGPFMRAILGTRAHKPRPFLDLLSDATEVSTDEIKKYLGEF